MSLKYTDPETGFIISTNSDSWRTDHKPSAEPEPVPEDPQHDWGDVGQGVRGHGGGIDMDRAKRDHSYYMANREAVEQMLRYEFERDNHI